MITHFQYQSLYENSQLPGWKFSFYFQKQRYTGIYHPNGKIEWTSSIPAADQYDQLIEHIHELMLFHVYDNR